MDQTKLEAQFKKLIKNPTIASYLTKDLYEYMHVRSGFIAHFDRLGFHKARFWTLADFDQTLELMRQNKDLKKLLDSVSSDEVGQARYRVASMEAGLLTTQARAMLGHVEMLQRKFNKDLV